MTVNLCHLSGVARDLTSGLFFNIWLSTVSVVFDKTSSVPELTKSSTSPMELQAIDFEIYGIVQGVYFRMVIIFFLFCV